MTYGADVSGPDTAERDPSNASGDKEIVSTNPNNIGGMTGQWEMHIRDGCPVLPPPSPPPPPQGAIPGGGEGRGGGEGYLADTGGKDSPGRDLTDSRRSNSC